VQGQLEHRGAVDAVPQGKLLQPEEKRFSASEGNHVK
jgi:hypothetical protein